MVVQFAIGAGNIVAGFSSRADHGTVGGTPYDASAIAATGTVSFDLKLTTQATAGEPEFWEFKVESAGGGAGTLRLTSSAEGHAAPELNVWQTYTFDIADLVAGGLNASAMDLFMVFPKYDANGGTVYLIDNVVINSGGVDTGGGDTGGGDNGGNTGLLLTLKQVELVQLIPGRYLKPTPLHLK
jgi:hypothetical protein